MRWPTMYIIHNISGTDRFKCIVKSECIKSASGLDLLNNYINNDTTEEATAAFAVDLYRRSCRRVADSDNEAPLT